MQATILMDIKSEPGFTEEQVTDLDVEFATKTFSVTLREDDTLTHNAGAEFMLVKNGKTDESVYLHIDQILWYSLRQRTLKTPIIKRAGPSPVTSDQREV